MITPVHKKKVQEKLKSTLPRAPEAALHQFFEFIVKGKMPDRTLANQLLDEKCSPNEIFMVLAYCRNVILAVHKTNSTKRKAEYLKKALLNHDRLTLWLMQASEEKHDAEWKSLQVQLLQEEYSHRLTRACHEWSKGKEITIYNYYKEMPVYSTLKLLKVGKSSFTVQKNDDLMVVLLASEHENTAFIGMPNYALCLQLTVVEATPKTVHLSYGEFSLVDRQKRREIRVLLTSPFQVTLRNSEFQAWECEAHDLSASGMRLFFNHEVPFHKGDAFVFTLWIHGEKIMGRGVITWLSHSDGHSYGGLSLEYNKASYNYLELEVQRRKKISLVELKLKGMPSCLLSD